MENRHVMADIEVITNKNELTINNLILKDFRDDLNNALQMAVAVANGLNVVTVSAKIVIEHVVADNDQKKIIDLKSKVTVTAKNDIWDNDNQVIPFITKRDDAGNMYAFSEDDDAQLRIEDLSGVSR